MNRFSQESPAPVRGRKPAARAGAAAAALLLLRQGMPKDESLDLFSEIQRSESPTDSAAPEEGVLMGGRRGVDDDLFYADVGKSDYDWLLTPPGTPLLTSSNGAVEQQLSSAAAKSNSRVRSASASKPSRLSVSSQPEIENTTKSGRASSATSSSVSSTYTSSTHLSNTKSSLVRRSSPSVTSKPSSPARQAAMRPVSAPASARLPSPARNRQALTLSADKHKPLPPSTPSARPRTPSTASSSHSVTPAPRSNPRQSTPTRLTPATARSTSVSKAPARTASESRAPARSASVGRSAGASARAVVRTDAMVNNKAKLAERPQSTSKQRSVSPASSNRRQASSPTVTRGRIQENSTKKANPLETKRPLASNTAVRISTKPASSVESNGFGRNISKKSLDVAVRHMDIRQGAGGIRGASLFPHSIRSTATNGRPTPTTNKAVPTTDDSRSLDRATSECGSTNGMVPGECNKTEASENGDSTTAKSPEGELMRARVSELDLYESTRYDAMLLKEDARNLNWLRSVDDVTVESPMFHRFEPPPEPFGLL